MKPATAAHLHKARTFLTQGQELLSLNKWPGEAGRAAYLAGYHAAQALVFESEGRTFKTRDGLHEAFAALTQDDPRFDVDQKHFLPQAHALKRAVDWEIGPDADVTREQAADALARARGLVATVAGVIEATA